MHSGLGRGRVPPHGRHRGEVGLAGLDRDDAPVHEGPDDVHNAVEKEGRVIIVQRAAEQLDIEGARRPRLIVLGVEQPHSGQQRGQKTARPPGG